MSNKSIIIITSILVSACVSLAFNVAIYGRSASSAVPPTTTVGSITVYKVVNGSDDYGTWAFFEAPDDKFYTITTAKPVIINNLPLTTTDSKGNTVPRLYTISENVYKNYITTYSNCESLDLTNANQTCTITNTKQTSTPKPG